MSAATTKILGRFAYQADVLTKGTRAPRRIDMWAPAEFEIATVSRDGLARDAFVIEPTQDHAGYGRANPLSLAAHDDALWSPMKPIRILGQAKALAHLMPISVERYVAQSAGDYERTYASDDPIRGALDRRLSATYHPAPDQNAVREDDFDGRVLWSNRGEALAAHVEAARDVLFVGDEVYTRRPEPTWTLFPPGGRAGIKSGVHISLTGLVTENGAQRFRLDRLEEAAEWANLRYPKARTETDGTILRADFSLLRRNDLACMVRDAAGAALHGDLVELAPSLSDRGVAAWRALLAASRSGPERLFLDDRVDVATGYLAEHLSTLVAEISVPTLPSNCGRARQQALALLVPLQARAEFELGLRPVRAATFEEDEAIGRLAATP